MIDLSKTKSIRAKRKLDENQARLQEEYPSIEWSQGTHFVLGRLFFDGDLMVEFKVFKDHISVAAGRLTTGGYETMEEAIEKAEEIITKDINALTKGKKGLNLI